MCPEGKNNPLATSFEFHSQDNVKQHELCIQIVSAITAVMGIIFVGMDGDKDGDEDGWDEMNCVGRGRILRPCATLYLRPLMYLLFLDEPVRCV